MRFTHTGHLLLATVGLFSAQAQSTGKPQWEVLMERPLPGDAIPNIHVVALPQPPAPPEPRPIGAGHTHSGPVFGYVVQGRIENQVEPDPPEVYNPGDVFYEAPRHVHRFMRNLSTESGNVIAFMAGYEGGAAPAIKVLFHDDLTTVTNQEVRLLRLTLPPGTSVDVPANANRDAVAVLEGEVAVGGTEPRNYRQNDFFAKAAGPNGLRISNPSSEKLATLLLYQVVAKGSPSIRYQ